MHVNDARFMFGQPSILGTGGSAAAKLPLETWVALERRRDSGLSTSRFFVGMLSLSGSDCYESSDHFAALRASSEDHRYVQRPLQEVVSPMANDEISVQQTGSRESELHVTVFQVKRRRGRPRKTEQKPVDVVHIAEKERSPLVFSNRAIEWRELDCERCKTQFTRLDDFQCYLRHLRDEHRDL